jgi:hypothetical protein
MRREEAEGQTKYRSEGLCAAKALASPINTFPRDIIMTPLLVKGFHKFPAFGKPPVYPVAKA